MRTATLVTVAPPTWSSLYRQSLLLALLGTVLLAMPTNEVRAHSLNDSYLDLSIRDEAVTGSLKVAIDDLEIALGLDSNGDRLISWGEIRQARMGIDNYWQARLQLHSAQQRCGIDAGPYQIEQLAGGTYLSIPLQGFCNSPPDTLSLQYELLFDIDRSHRGIVAIDLAGTTSTHIMAPQRQSLALEAEASGIWSTLAEFVREGVWHIWIGIDHILFLAAMLLGVVLHQRRSAASKTALWRASVLETFKLVTAFTLAHSITLVLASAGLVALPPALVESAIALSVVISGINIVVPIFGRFHWQFAFAFGLIHGFGFANVLGDLNLPVNQFVISLLGFNLGVEVGQFVIVLVTLPVLLLLTRQHRVRQVGALVSGLVVAQIGLLWLIERGL